MTKFRVGDRVRRTGVQIDMSVLEIGQLGTVDEILKSGFYVKFDRPGSDGRTRFKFYGTLGKIEKVNSVPNWKKVIQK